MLVPHRGVLGGRPSEKAACNFCYRWKTALSIHLRPTFVKAFGLYGHDYPHFRPNWTRIDWKRFGRGMEKGYKTVTEQDQRERAKEKRRRIPAAG